MKQLQQYLHILVLCFTKFTTGSTFMFCWWYWMFVSFLVSFQFSSTNILDPDYCYYHFSNLNFSYCFYCVHLGIVRKTVNSHKVFTIIVPFKYIIIVMYYIELCEEVAPTQKEKLSFSLWCSQISQSTNSITIFSFLFLELKNKKSSKSYKLQVDK